MNTSSNDELQVRLTVDDAHTAQAAGVTFARTLSGAHLAEFTLALAEQKLLIERAIVEAGYSVEQARLAAEYFATAARGEWQLEVAGGSYLRGTA